MDSFKPALRDQVDSLLDWWRSAGVDTIIEETPRQWLTEELPPPRPATAPSEVPQSRPGTNPAEAKRAVSLPDTLDAFLAWRAGDVAMLDDYPPRRRLAPEGPSTATLMIVADVPERSDADAGRLLTGEAGALFDKMLVALKLDRRDVLLTTLAPGRPPSGMLADAEIARLAPVLLRHVRLAAPQRLWLMGRAASRAILAMDERQAAGNLHTVNAEGVMVSVIATLHPRVLLREAKAKTLVWADMQRLMGTDG